MMQYDFAEDIWHETCPLCKAVIEGTTKGVLLSLIDRHNKAIHNNREQS